MSATIDLEESEQALKIALVAPPLLPVPPVRYGGVERIVGVLADGLVMRGHDVTLFAPGDSKAAGRLVPTVPVGIWSERSNVDPAPWYARTTELVLYRAREFDMIHLHLDALGFDLAAAAPVPVVATIHNRTDMDPLASAIGSHPTARLVAISDSQRSFIPEANWLTTIHHGLDFSAVAEGAGGGGYLLFIGSLSADKGIGETVELARRSGRTLRIAAKALDPTERAIYEHIVAPAESAGVVEFLGEVGQSERDRLLGEALATVMLSRWPEPFGLVAIESLATGTPIIASRRGALPEIVEDGVDGYVVDDVAAGVAAVNRVGTLDRALIRRRTLKRFSAARMVDSYVEVYRRILSESQPAPSKSR